VNSNVHAGGRDLVSLVCSGESLEKAVVLSILACQTNQNFYGSFQNVHVFFGDNLPKTAANEPAHGTLATAVRHIGGTRLLPLKDQHEVLDNQTTLLGRLQTVGRISERMASALETDPHRCLAILGNSPWDELLPEQKGRLLASVKALAPNFEFHRVDLRTNTDHALSNLPIHARSAQLFTLNPDGRIKASPIGGRGRLRESVERRVQASVACSGNVYVFVAEAVRQAAKICPDATIGYPMFDSPSRRSFKDVFELLTERGTPLQEEPEHSAIKKVGDTVLHLPYAHQPTAAFYQAFNELGLADVPSLDHTLTRNL
jgi:hypothetical protein